ncbi:PREDICTED: uncharacterized protein LOC104743131 [Camelina sativa]|uniref:Uncharacterized protein LOC104743131 n=1 Tax=Camelina sativa TaxID=90675 RepID=A0ABM0VXI7_CAMSA|nr:PREDICTED: uncharacterized protein LOC104743131 [Camelina sativa]
MRRAGYVFFNLLRSLETACFHRRLFFFFNFLSSDLIDQLKVKNHLWPNFDAHRGVLLNYYRLTESKVPNRIAIVFNPRYYTAFGCLKECLHLLTADIGPGSSTATRAAKECKHGEVTCPPKGETLQLRGALKLLSKPPEDFPVSWCGFYGSLAISRPKRGGSQVVVMQLLLFFSGWSSSFVKWLVPPILTEPGKVKNHLWPNFDAHSGVLLKYYRLTESKCRVGENRTASG